MSSTLRRLAPALAWVVAAFWLVTGVWAFVAPESFYDAVATFPPYNVHFVHDIGAFSFGLGTTIALVVALADRWHPARSVLVGVGVGSVLHVLSHVLDYEIKSSVSDVVGLSLFTLLTFAAAAGFDRESS
jgi:ABC-type Fe3+-siderophore transport system permease subunit